MQITINYFYNLKNFLIDKISFLPRAIISCCSIKGVIGSFLRRNFINYTVIHCVIKLLFQGDVFFYDLHVKIKFSYKHKIFLYKNSCENFSNMKPTLYRSVKIFYYSDLCTTQHTHAHTFEW